MIRVGIIGSTGYAGGELVRILMGHKEVEIKWFGSRSYIDKKYADVYQNMFQIVDAVCMDDNMEELADEVDVIFTATPQGLCASLVNEDILSKTKIIDLSADFRMKDVEVYEEWYKIKHPSPQFMEEAVYGLCEVTGSGEAGAAWLRIRDAIRLVHFYPFILCEGGTDRYADDHHRCEVRNIRSRARCEGRQSVL